MVLVNCPLMQEDIIKIIEEYKIEDKQVFKLVNKKKIQLYFESTIENDNEACQIVKGIIKSYKYSPALVYHVTSFSEGTINWYK